jgi:hypothetical protein
MQLKETGCEDVDFVHLAQDSALFLSYVNTVINLKSSGKLELL